LFELLHEVGWSIVGGVRPRWLPLVVGAAALALIVAGVIAVTCGLRVTPKRTLVAAPWIGLALLVAAITAPLTNPGL
jgi:hypothetical protein